MPPRHTRPADSNEIENLILAAFGKDEALEILPLVNGFLNAPTDPPVISLVSAEHDQIDGFIAFSPVFPVSGSGVCGYILAPLAVLPAHQRQGIGSLLIKHGLTSLAERNADLVLVYGNPHYYGRFGFEGAIAEAFQPPFEMAYPAAWQGCCWTAAPCREHRSVLSLCLLLTTQHYGSSIRDRGSRP